MSAARIERPELVAAASMLLTVGICLVVAAAASAFATRKPAGQPFGSFAVANNIAVDQSNGNLFVSDGEPDELVQVLGPLGGSPMGETPAQLTAALTPQKAFEFRVYHVGLAADSSCYLHNLAGGACAAFDPSNGDIYVSDPIRNVVDKFHLNGSHEFEYVCQFSGYGGIAGTSCLSEGGSPSTRYSGPEGATVDPNGDLYVADWGNQAIYEYDPEGEAIQSFSSPLLEHPEYIAVDIDGTIYAQSWGTAKLIEFKRSSPTGPVEGEPTEVMSGITGGVVVDPVTHRVIVATSASIEELDQQHHVVATFGAGLVEGGTGLAFDQASEHVYVIAGQSQHLGGHIQAFGPRLTLPDASTGGTTGVLANGATLEGAFNPLGTQATYHFEYGESSTYGLTTPTVGGEGEEEEPVRAEAVGLAPNTTYHYRLLAENENGSSSGEDRTFTTPAIAPALGQVSASNVTRASILLHGTINPEAAGTTYDFEFVGEAGYQPAADNPYADGGTTQPTSAGSQFETVAVAQLVAGLEPNTTYHYALVASNKAGTVVGPDATFSTGALTPPTVVTGEAGAVAQNSATIGGTVGTSGLATSYGFEIGTSTDYGPVTGSGSIGAGASDAAVTLNLTGLQPGATYHYRLTASNVDGTTHGADQTFTTSTFASVLVTPPAPLPFVTVPAIAFPPDAGATTSTRALTNARKLASALRACKRKPKRQRAACQRRAHKRYGPSRLRPG